MGCARWTVTVAALVGVARAEAAPEPGTLLVASDLGWPETTAVATVRTRAPVLDTAERGKRIAVVARGTRVTWRRIVASRDGCKAWLELEPRGWACAKDLAPSSDPSPAATASNPPPRYADVRTDGADAYDTPDDIKTGTISKHVDDKTYVVVKGKTKPIKVDGIVYLKTDQGWIASKDLSWYSPSTYAGIDVTAQTSFSIGWAVAKKPGAKIAVRSAPNVNAPKVRELAPRDLVTIAEVAGDMARIGPDEWVEAVELRKPARVARPEGVGASERWVDVDLDQQILVAYQGDDAVFVTVISSGRAYWETPTGIYRITGKEEKSRMQYQGEESWNVADVPFSMRFRKNYALHGTYWHEGFGRARSHGCVNLSTTDAKRLFGWVSPAAPAGWSSVEAAGDGTPVRIHSRRDPDPIWRGYDGKPL